ncbi:MAG: transglutaminase-like putative cysteine protease [Granulosicoccus sp.]|jgi:transglutaminase-like putative cysteine protease
MKRIETCSTLTYFVNTTSAFLFQISVAENEHQTVLEESVETDPPLEVEFCELSSSGNRLVRLVSAPGPLVVRYRAVVELTQDLVDPRLLEECSFSELPAEVLSYLNPSRYCESDRLTDFAWNEFGALAPGHTRVSSIVDWVHNYLNYVPGSTGPTTTACDVLVQRTGVCRDYAHLTIALCRALGIPARYLAGYAVDLQTPDFHGFCEVWLGESWYLFDATKLAPIAGLVRVGAGRDAAEVSFATIIGSVDVSIAPQVMAVPILISERGYVTEGTGAATADGDAVSIG